ncbi:MAG: hypothetical protein SFT92_03535 [Rickettsiales bacterium]|nr:hypothetical protein [Rickettsiales bacterium]
MHVSNSMPGQNTQTSATGTKTQQTDNAFAALLEGTGDDPEAFLHKITSNGISGYWSWQIEQLRKKIAAEVMQENNVSQESLAKMDDAARTSLEQKIMDEVERRVKEMVENQMNNEKKNGMPIRLTSAATTHSLISLTQEI